MKNSVNIGMNKTGLGLAPQQAPEMLDQRDKAFKAFAQAEDDPMPALTDKEIRQQYNRESGSIGSVPPPGTLKGAVVSGIQKMTFRHPEVLLDKLGERMAFERSGTRLYESFIQKCETALPESSFAFLREIQQEELRHFYLLKEAIESLGADPTSVTPCANVSAVSSMGLMQVVNDPRTSVAQAAQAILTAELVDNDGWPMLIKLTEKAGLTELVEKFREAEANEVRHLSLIRAWLDELVDVNDVTDPDKNDQLH